MQKKANTQFKGRIAPEVIHKKQLIHTILFRVDKTADFGDNESVGRTNIESKGDDMISQITLTGTVVAEPVYFEKTAEKKAFTSIRVASTPRQFDRDTNEWVDGTTTWLDVSAYGALAENAAKSFQKGDPIFASGVMTTREYTDSEGNDGSSNVVKATAIGHNLLFGQSVFSRNEYSAADQLASEQAAADPTEPKATKKK